MAEETLEGSRISLANEDGTKLVSIYPKVSGSISDAQVQAEPDKYGGAQVATEDMLTPDLLSWTLGATVGINRWSSERNAKTDFEHSCLGKRQSRAAESRQRKAKPSTGAHRWPPRTC